ncbi:hypothetical protein GCM10009765_63590 [Fodinicola feengrottensis]|uniref:Uncharacterized protein n=1 Tax=Fodinicola feengrottensis TaxID=435914 RepID=A0ABN2II90_9ACTN
MTCLIGSVASSARQIAAPLTPVEPITATTRGDSPRAVTAALPENWQVVPETTARWGLPLNP